MMNTLKQKLGIKQNVLKLVTYVTYNKTSNRMLIYTGFVFKIWPYSILYKYNAHSMLFKCLQIG